MKREANFQTVFGHWWKAKWRKTGLFELKQTRTDSLPFSSVVPHQIEALLNAKHGGLFYKIPDVGYQNPADAFGLCGEDAFVVIKYPDFFCLVDIDDFIREKETSSRRSLTEDRARVIATHIIE